MNNKQPKYIETWEELAKEESPTHILDIDLEYCNGWIRPKNDIAENSYEGEHYLSTHTFYGSQHAQSTKILQLCGFNVELANWDA